MTMLEMFRAKYREFLKKMDSRTWKAIERFAKEANQSITTVIYNNYITVYANEIKDWAEVIEAKEQKLITEISRSHQTTRYKLTNKGINIL